VPLFNILVQLLAETSPHAGHADISREDLDGAVGTDAESTAVQRHDQHCIASRSAYDDGERSLRRQRVAAGVAVSRSACGTAMNTSVGGTAPLSLTVIRGYDAWAGTPIAIWADVASDDMS